MKARTKQLQLAGNRFQRTVEEYLVAQGAVPSDGYAFQMETKAGVLKVTAFDNWIATRFEDLERAKTVLGVCLRLNRYSGKWNFHFDEESIATLKAVEIFALNLELILADRS